MDNISFSVLLSVYHADKTAYLDTAISSIIYQSFPPTEIVLVKDGPIPKDIDNIIEKWRVFRPKLFKIITLKRNCGLGTALKIGLEACTNEVVARMDSDDISEPHRFQRQYEYLARNCEVDIVGSYISEFKLEPNRPFAIRRVPIEHFQIKKMARYRSPLNHVSVMFRKDAVIKAGGYDSFLFQEDYYLWVRMLLHCSKFANIPEVLVKVRVEQGMFGRRRGFKYLVNELKLHLWFYKKGFIGVTELLRNCGIRIVLRLMPCVVLEKVYSIIRKTMIPSYCR
jgi:glycosyltransferase involved in cell wall biosynthesis